MFYWMFISYFIKYLEDCYFVLFVLDSMYLRIMYGKVCCFKNL